MACVWFFSARYSQFSPQTWVSKANLVDKDQFTQYITSYYWYNLSLLLINYLEDFKLLQLLVMVTIQPIIRVNNYFLSFG